MGPGVPSDAFLLLLPWQPISCTREAECYFHNGTQQVRFLARYIYDRQEIARFDSDLGKFVAVTALAEAQADAWNRDEQLLQYNKACVDSFCRHNYEADNFEAAKREERLIGRRTPESPASPQDPNSPPVRDLGSL
ncbi:putative MHC class II antigen protein [Naja naja]|nr:putative MHC class II antigen protein [Naja naja]